MATTYRSIVLISDEMGDTLEIYRGDDDCFVLIINGSDVGSDGESINLGHDGINKLFAAIEFLRGDNG